MPPRSWPSAPSGRPVRPARGEPAVREPGFAETPIRRKAEPHPRRTGRPIVEVGPTGHPHLLRVRVPEEGEAVRVPVRPPAADRPTQSLGNAVGAMPDERVGARETPAVGPIGLPADTAKRGHVPPPSGIAADPRVGRALRPLRIALERIRRKPW